MTGQKTRVAIVGYGNLGRGVETVLPDHPDMALTGIFTRRDPASITPLTDAAVHPLAHIDAFRGQIDVLILCGGSKTDLPQQAPELAGRFNTVDSFDTHARIPQHFAAVDARARAAGHTAVISAGWDPGLFSLNRLYGEAILPRGSTYTFWGRGLSQGHSDAVRRVPGVKAAVQYTEPLADAVAQVRSGGQPTLTTRERHRRECHVVLEPGADAEVVEQAIVSMPDYFADYDTQVHFIDEQTLRREHAGMPHGGFVMRSARTGGDQVQSIEYALKLDSNPQLTASVLVACARAAWRLNQRGETGACTMLDIAPALLSPRSPEELRAGLL